MRVVEIDGQPWFVAHEAVHILGISKGREESAYRRLAEDEYRYADRKSVAKRGGRPIRLVSESGLYKLIMRSDKPEGSTPAKPNGSVSHNDGTPKQIRAALFPHVSSRRTRFSK